MPLFTIATSCREFPMPHDPRLVSARPLRRCLTALPLLLLLGAAPGKAATVFVDGLSGLPGPDGTAGSPDGGPGGDGSPAIAVADQPVPFNEAFAYSRAGGAGGNGAATGAAGAGGNGGDATATASATGTVEAGFAFGFADA
jgi:hypothetical protein